MKNITLSVTSSAILLSCILTTGCRKEKINYDYLNGSWPMMGTGCASGEPCVKNAFAIIKILALDDKNIVVDKDTLPYQSSLSKKDTIVFKKDESQYYKLRYAELMYDKKQGVLIYNYQYNFSNAGASYEVSNYAYRPNPNIRNYVSKIVGTKMMTGMYYDTLYHRLPTEDSSSALNLPMTFSAATDSSIAYNSLLPNMPEVLYYKYTDETSGTVVFQSEATLSNLYSLLTYNYVTNTFVFEQILRSLYRDSYVKLQ